MEFRASTAPPDHGRPGPHSLCASDISERPVQSERKSPPSPDSIELAAASLFTRVRAIITRRDGTDERSSSRLSNIDDDDPQDDSPAGSVTPYYADEGESGGDSGSNRASLSTSATLSRMGESRMGNSWLRYTTNEALIFPYSSSPDSAIRLRSGAERSIAGSTVTDPDPTLFRRPYFLHSSTDQIHKNLPKRISNRALGKVTPSPAASKVGTIGRRSDDSSSDEEAERTDVTVGGIDPEHVRMKILNRPPSTPIPLADPIFSVVYDSSSSSRTRPDLFPRPLNPDSPARWPADTPINSLASPKPLIGVIPPTPAYFTSSSEKETSARAKKRSDKVFFDDEIQEITSTVVAHTGASTPEGDDTMTANKGTMTELDYDEYLRDDFAESSYKYTVQGAKMPRVQTPYFDKGRATESESNQTAEGLRDSMTKDAFSALSSYDDSDPPQDRQFHTMRDEYLRSNAALSRTTSTRPHSQSLDSSMEYTIQKKENPEYSREIPLQNAPATTVPIPFNSFTGIITDLEDMLNQALALASRAVEDSNTALEERDASMKSARESATSSMRNTVHSHESPRPSLYRVVTAPEFAESALKLGSLSLKDFSGGHTHTDEPPERTEAEPASADAVKARKVFGPLSASQDDQRVTSSSNRAPKDTAHNTTPRTEILAQKQEKQSLRVDGLRVDSSRERAGGSKSSRSLQKSLGSRLTDEEAKFRMEMGRNGEIILVKIPGALGHHESFSRTKNVEVSRPRYQGGWQWGLWGKRFVAAVACAVVGLIGWIVGNYHAEATAIQKYLQISPYVTSLGNSMFFLGLAIPTSMLWPLSLLHGRKPYLLVSIALLLPLQLPQALSLPPYTNAAHGNGGSMQPYIVCLLFFRTLSGIILGLAFMNTLSTLIDLFGPDTGACCRGGVVFSSQVPMEGQNQFSSIPGGESGVRIGIWLGIYIWLFASFQGIGFVFGKITIAKTTPAWGFWIITIIGGILLIFIVLGPEVRPPWSKKKLPQRRANRVPQARIAREIVERGEIKMVVFGSSPRWWWEEVWAGLILSWTMMKQIGFFVISLYVGWVFGYLIMVVRLLASLIMDAYGFRETRTGLAVLGTALGALFSVPVQLSTFYSTNFRHRSVITLRNRHYGHRHKGLHPYRWALYVGSIMLPIASMALAISAGGPPTHYIAPIIFAALVSFSGTLAIAECHVLLMDNFDTSDLPEIALSSISGSTSQGASSTGLPHGTQRPIAIENPDVPDNFTTSHPTVTSGLAIFHGLSFVFAAAAVGFSTYIIDGIGIRGGLGVYTALTALFSAALAAVLWRRKGARMLEVFNVDDGSQGMGDGVRICRISLLQQGKLSRWSEVNGMEYDGADGRV